MESDQNKMILPLDCQGTCKTTIGCTCYKVNKRALNKTPDNGTETTGGCACKSGGGGCSSGGCSSGGSCACKSGGGGCTKKSGGCCAGKNKLEVYNWMNDYPASVIDSQMVEVQFKNTRKGYFLNSNNIDLFKGDIVAVEASPGHDIGEVTLTGKLVQLQMKKNNYRNEIKRIYRIAKPSDLEKAEEARAKEHKTMLRAREIAEKLQLDMKISDVEYQGDGNKAIFYYIADERVDFRQLIKDYAAEFRVKIEMKQIGARQEAGRVGGIGPCGRELCCSSSMSNFVSVSTSAARLQDIPLNPQKLAGQCGKLKCCLNFEVDTYVEAQRQLPPRETVLETKDSAFFHFKTDILSGMMTYSTDKYFAANLVTLPKDRVHDIIRMNKKGDRPLHLNNDELEKQEKAVSLDVLEQESITRFDNNGNNRNKKKKLSKSKSEGNRNEVNSNRPEHKRSENGRPEIKKVDSVKKQENKDTRNNSNSENNAAGNRPPQSQNQNKRNNRNNRNRPPRGEKPNNPKTDA